MIVIKDVHGVHLFCVENGKIALDGSCDMTPYLTLLFRSLRSTDINRDSCKLKEYINEAAIVHGIDRKCVPSVVDSAIFLMYMLSCFNPREQGVSELANDEPGVIAGIAFDRLFRENGSVGRIRNGYPWHLVLWKLFCLQYNCNPSAELGEMFLGQYFCLSEIIYISGDYEKAKSSFDDVIRLGLEISSQAEMSDGSYQQLGLSYYYRGCIYRNYIRNEVSAFDDFRKAVSYLERFSSILPIKKILDECRGMD